MTQALHLKSCDKKFKTAELKLMKILNKINSFKLHNSYLSELVVHRKKKGTLNGSTKCHLLFTTFFTIILLTFWWIYVNLTTKNCALEVPSASKMLFRPPEDCTMCIGVEGVTRVSNITPRDFEDRFAYGSSPVIVTDATEGWRAVQEFDFKFFAEFYRSGKMGQQINDCFYFSYKSGLNSLQEVFDMDEKRANLSGEPWYVGWSTCYDDETRKLRGYYSRPYFLPTTAESEMVDWIFMGGPGQGAHMHVDSVRHMSWQAQIRGHKQWQLAPPPECFYRCSWITFTVAPGEILVVDTNRWYHKTDVLPGDISITIGAEYD